MSALLGQSAGRWRFASSMLICALVAVGGCGETNATSDEAPAATGQWQRVVLLDQGLNMPAGSLMIPTRWKHSASIATDPGSGLSQRYRLEVRGPDGETFIGLGSASYGSVTSTPLEQALLTLVNTGLGSEFAALSLGPLRPSAELAQSQAFRRLQQKSQANGLHPQALEAPMQAQRAGKPMRGKLYVTSFYSESAYGSVGTASATAVLAPPERVEQALAINLRIAESARPDPAYEQRIAAIGTAYRQRQSASAQASLQQQNASFQAGQRQREAAFQSQQQGVRERSQLQDQSHQRYMESLRSKGGAGSNNSGYTEHEGFIDHIYERTSFDDPHSGQRVSRDGYYDHWYQDNRGHYYGTNDPNYQPPNDWEHIEPLSPGQ